MESRYRLTKQFLLKISSRLSSRLDCKHINYLVYIGIDPKYEWKNSYNDFRDASNYVFFIPGKYVYPNLHRKTSADRLPIIDYVVLHHFKDELFNGYDEYGKLRIYTNNLVNGIYEYQLSVNGKYRRWTKLIEIKE